MPIMTFPGQTAEVELLSTAYACLDSPNGAERKER
jgi:hypothetical protein